MVNCAIALFQRLVDMVAFCRHLKAAHDNHCSSRFAMGKVSNQTQILCTVILGRARHQGTVSVSVNDKVRYYWSLCRAIVCGGKPPLIL